MTTITEIIWRVLGYQGKSFDYTHNNKKYVLTATSRHIILQKRPEQPEQRYSYGYRRSEGYTADAKSSEIVLDFDLTDRTFGLYVDWELPQEIILGFKEALNISDEDMPIYDIDANTTIGVMTPNEKRFPNVIQVPRVITERSHNYWSYPTLDYPNGETLIEGKHLKIHNGVVHKFDQNTIYNWLPHYLQDKFQLPNGEDCHIISYGNWWLVKEKKIGDYSQWYPIDMEGKPLKGVDSDPFWKERGNNSRTLIKRLICENEVDLEEDFDDEMINYHFYGRSVDDNDIINYFENLKNNDGCCPCERCQGFKIYKREKGEAPYYRGWTIQHYKAMHAGIKGSLPSDRDLLKDCDCKACKSFRNTRERKENYLREKFYSEMKDKGYDWNEIQYITGGWKADPQIYPDEIPANGLMTIDDWNWRPKSKWFKRLFSEYGKATPINFQNIAIRFKLAYLHCRLTLVEWADAPQEAASWLTEVWNTQFKPECNCKLCTELKEDPNMQLTIANELLMEPVNPATYTTAVFNVHFQTNYWSSRELHPKQDYIDYFNTYILYGKYCECEKCKNFMDKVGDSEYLPPDELVAPKCPLCGGSVHNKDLIYQNKEIAKAVIEKGASNLIGVKTALCCSCYNKFRMDRARRARILEMNPGEYFYAEIRGERNKEGELAGMKRRTIKEVWPEDTPKEEKEPGTGTLFVKDTPLSEFVSLNNVTFKLPEAVENALEVRDLY